MSFLLTQKKKYIVEELTIVDSIAYYHRGREVIDQIRAYRSNCYKAKIFTEEKEVEDE